MLSHVFTELANTSKSTEKLEILRNQTDNSLLTKVLKAALDPYIAYNIKKIPDYNSNDTPSLSVSDFVDEINKLATREVTGNDGIEFLKGLLESVPSSEAFICENIIKKDLRCGVQQATVNKVWKNLIPTYPCLLGKVYDEKTIEKIAFPAYSQLKADGMRANVIIDNNTVTIRGRSGKVIDLLGILESDFLDLDCADCVLDGELIVVNNDGTVMDRKKGNGILNKGIRGKISEKEASMVRFRVWDIIPLRDFKSYRYTVPYHHRYNAVVEFLEKHKLPKVELIETRVVQSLEDAQVHFDEMLHRGEEGTMIKDMNHIWEDKRSPHVLKLKAERDCDLQVVGYNLGTPGTKWEGKLGSLVCRSSDGKVEVNISGFSDELREEIFENIDDWVGKIVTVLYNERIKSKEKGREDLDSLFLPRFCEVREDKDEADDSSKIV